MKAKILVGLVAAGLLGGTAMAHDGVVQPRDPAQRSPDSIGGSGLQQASPQEINDLQQADVAPPPPVDMTLQGEGVGGSGMVNAPVPSSGAIQEKPCDAQPATGGSGMSAPTSVPSSEMAAPASSSALEPAPLQGEQVIVDQNDAFVAPKKMSRYERKMQNADAGQKKGDMRGLTLLVGAGVEGYTGGLAPEVNPGAALGVTAALKPTKVLGIELGYSGAVNNLSTAVGGSGPDIIRNGGQAALTLGLTASPIQPYVLGGFGLSYYNVRHGEELGFRSDTSRTIPVGVGLRTHIHDFTADARVNYNVLLDNGFASDVASNLWTGRYTGTLNLGGTF